MNVPFSPPDITEEEVQAVAEALRSGWITTGPRTKQFEQEIGQYLKTGHAVCLNSATAAMEMTLRLLGVGPGDEVITTAYTYTATASVVCHVGATLVLVDTDGDSYEMDYEKAAAAVTERTKVIIPVDLAGKMCNYQRIFQLVEEKKGLFRPEGKLQEAIGRIVVMADGAHAFGARAKGKMCGQAADFTCFSFHAVKNLTTAEGGAVTWNTIPGIEDQWIYQQYMLLSLHGQSKDALAKTKLGSWEYDILSLAYKCNMTDIMAAIGLVQLKRYPALLKRRRELIERYEAGLSVLPVTWLNHYGEDFASSGHLFLVQLTGKSMEFRNRLIEKLAEKGIATNVHYKPLPMLTAYRNLGFSIEEYPHARELFQREITLPLHTCLKDEQVDYVIQEFVRCYQELVQEMEA
ncbi:MAG TPA: DegT/DnrJ/EryC1/StrS aminotransferase family protein [Candidatus Cottocaccamicrobium excrementipullorum]|nr:DegT/DnrJ/EryC1/StrS aminotransferase family protein [Candidatus Cottocaccamicrobium excrementipullorum]